MNKVAALDLGSNTFLCLIAEASSSGELSVLEDLTQTVRLGQDIDKTKRLHPEALIRAERCFREFSERIRHHRVKTVKALATSAARDAENGEELFKLGERYGIPIEIISGSKEAEISFLGATYGHLKPGESIAVVDIGGGSTEIIVGSSSGYAFAESVNAGGVRMTERHIHAQPVSKKDRDSLQEDIEKTLQPLIKKIRGQKIDRFLAVAGTPTTLAALELGGFDFEKVDGFYMSLERLKAWKEIFGQTSVEEKLKRYPDLGKRADIIYAGASILVYILEQSEQEGFYVSTKGVRYGLALDLLRSSSWGQ